jgi:hypothetical protein
MASSARWLRTVGRRWRTTAQSRGSWTRSGRAQLLAQLEPLTDADYALIDATTREYIREEAR